MTSEDDYGNAFSRHCGNYTGAAEEECRICGSVRTMDRREADRQDTEAAEKASAYNLSAEGLEFWRKRSLKNDGAIMVYDGGTVCRLESGDAFNGESQVLSEGKQGRWFGPRFVFVRGEKRQDNSESQDAAAIKADQDNRSLK